MAKEKTIGNLQQRGHQYYLKMAIPPSLRRYFLSSTGKPQSQIQQPLKDAYGRGLSYEEARVVLPRRVAQVRELFERLRREPTTTPEQVRAALRGPEDMDQDELDRAINESLGGSQATDEYIQKRNAAIRAAIFEAMGSVRPPGLEQPAPMPARGETISQAAEAWFQEITRDKATAPRPLTIEGHRKRVQAFVDKVGDKPLTDVTRAMASDFLATLNVRTGTRNAYATTLRSVFESAKQRGRFTGDNPFNGMKKKAKGESYAPFTIAELQTVFDDLPRDVAPTKHTPDTALPWVALIALYTGMRLEEIAQLTVADIRAAGANGATVTVIDVHNGGTNKLKNETSARLVPVHSALVRAGLLDYVKAVKVGPLFPGLKRRASKGGKVGARLGELFRKQLVALGIKREGLCFHSFRHTVAGRLDAAEVRQSDAARILGHAVAGMSYGEYSKAGPGLKHVASVVERIKYEGLRL
jgi:integrase